MDRAAHQGQDTAVAGPQTPAGKQRAKQNATKTGIFAKATVITDGPLKESPEESEAVENAYVRLEVPRGRLGRKAGPTLG